MLIRMNQKQFARPNLLHLLKVQAGSLVVMVVTAVAEALSGRNSRGGGRRRGGVLPAVQGGGVRGAERRCRKARHGPGTFKNGRLRRRRRRRRSHLLQEEHFGRRRGTPLRLTHVDARWRGRGEFNRVLAFGQVTSISAYSTFL